MKEIKELNGWSVGGNIFHPEEGYLLTLFNEDENGNETDTVVINLSEDRIHGLIAALRDMVNGGYTILERNEYEEPTKIYICGLTFKCTCTAFPEQYDVYDINNKQVGYVRLRHGYLYAECPDCGGEEVYDAYPDGDGCFYTAEDRKFHLTKIAEKILEWRFEQKKEGRD